MTTLARHIIGRDPETGELLYRDPTPEEQAASDAAEAEAVLAEQQSAAARAARAADLAAKRAAIDTAATIGARQAAIVAYLDSRPWEG